MVTKDCYVERAMERLTVTTMRLCSDLPMWALRQNPARGGFALGGGLWAGGGGAGGGGGGPLAPAVPRDFLCAIIGLSGQKCALPGCIAGVLMGQRDRSARPFLAPNSQSPGFGLRNDIFRRIADCGDFGPCCGGDGGGGRQLAAGCTTPRDFMRFWGWCGQGRFRAHSPVIGKWRFPRPVLCHTT